MELFYDVVYAFAVSQLSHHLLEDLTPRGLGETVVLLAAVFTVWVLTSFEATYFDVARRRVQLAVLAAMALGLLMNAEIPKAFTGDGLAFAVPLVVTQLGRGVLTATRAPTAALRVHYRRLLGWVAASAPLWLVGALVGADDRLWWWAGAAAVDVAGVWLAHPVPGRGTVAAGGDVDIDGSHITERLRLFLIIALGEVVLTTGDAVSEAPTRALTLLAAAGSFTVVGCLWAVYFGGRGDMDETDAPTDRDPVRSARTSANGQYLVLAGMVGVAVACERVVEEPEAAGSVMTSALLFGGLLLYLGTQTAVLALTAGGRRAGRWVSVAALAAAGGVSVLLPAVLALLLACAVLLPLTALVLRRRVRAVG